MWNDTAAPPKPSSNDYLPIVVAASSPMDMLTLELLHHFTHYTSLTLHQHSESIEVWRTVAPSLTFSANASFLLHAMLAVSGLHLHTLHGGASAAKYACAAASHRTQAMRELPRACDLPPGAEDETLFLTHTLFSMYGLATSSSLFERNDWLGLLRTQPGMVNARFDAYWTGPVGPLIRTSHSVHKFITSLMEEEEEEEEGPVMFPSSLATIHLPSVGAPEVEELRDPRVADAYQKAVVFLRRAWLASLNPSSQTYAATIWLVFAPQMYWNLLYERRPRALVIAGHWCAIMRRMRGPWWIQRRWTAELDGIMGVVGSEWRRWCDWVPDVDGGHLIEADSDLFSWLTHPAI